MRTLLALAAFALAPLAPGLAAAQDAPACREVRPGYLVCAEQTVEGRRPGGFVLLGRSRTDWEPPPLVRRDAAGQVVRSVRRAPF